MNLQQTIMMAQQMPQVRQLVNSIETQIGNAPITPKDLDSIIQMLQAILQNPARYPQVRAAAIRDGILDAADIPVKFDAIFIVSLLIVMTDLRKRISIRKYARGGLHAAAQKVQAAGRGGDTILAHINPREAEMLKRMGGSGTVNPNTGLQEYKSIWKIFKKIILPVVAAVAVPFLAPVLAPALGVTSVLGTAAVGTALGAGLGAATSAIAGENPLKGAAFGALSGGGGGLLGKGLSETARLGLGEFGQGVLGNTLAGGAIGAATGQGFTQGALQGAVGGALGGATQNVGTGTTGNIIGSAGRNIGNLITVGTDPKQAIIQGGLTGIAGGILGGLRAPTTPATPSTQGYPVNQAAWENLAGAGKGAAATVGTTGGAAQQPSGGILNKLFAGPSAGTTTGTEGATSEVIAPSTRGGILGGGIAPLAAAGLALGMVGNKPPEAIQAVQELPPSIQEYFNRPGTNLDWNKLMQESNMANQSLSEYIATNWPTITSGKYDVSQAFNQQNVQNAAHGGVMTNLAQGSGSGRDDTIDAKLSDGEYVIDAETVALIGDGSTKEGAKRLDDMRRQIRMQKGKALAKGKFSPNAKSPMNYLKRIA